MAHKHPKNLDLLEKTWTRLKGEGFKSTEPRRLLLEVLTEQHGPFTPDQLYELVQKKKPKSSCDLVTIYRSLETFEKLGVVTRCNFGDAVARFELVDEDHHHHHIICEQCRRAEPIDVCPIGTKDLIPKNLGYEGVRHSLEFFGTCPACQKKSKKT